MSLLTVLEEQEPLSIWRHVIVGKTLVRRAPLGELCLA